MARILRGEIYWADLDPVRYSNIYGTQFEGRGLLVLKRIRNFHREYGWS